VRAALRIQEAVERLNDEDHSLQLAVRVAVTTGEAIVQIDGDDPDRERIIGDVVNTASRLEGVAPAGGVVVDERTYLASRGAIRYDDLDMVNLKGKATSTAIWLATGARARQGVAVEDRHTGPFVGRDTELALMTDAFERTLQTQAVQLVTVIGEPGAGKSRLLHEFKATLDARSDVVWWKQGRCLPYGEGITFWALGEIVKAQAGILDSDAESEVERKLRHAVTTLIEDATQAEWVRARLLPLAGGGSDDQVVEQSELFSAWLRFFEAMAQQHPLVMVVEDIHWADDALLDFLEHVAEWAVGVPILLVCAARPELLSDRSDWGGGLRNAATISLAPLANDEAAVLLSALLGRSVLLAETQQLILERAGGNPLYVTEFVRLAADSDLLAEGKEASDLTLPDSVQAIIAARLDLLDAETKELIQAAAVIGKVFWTGALAALRPATHPETTLRELVRREMIRPIRDPSMKGQDEFTFVHALVRDVAYVQIARDDRARLHQAAAGWIEAVSADRGVDVSILLAYHLGETMALVAEPDVALRAQAYRALMQAGERAGGLDVRRATGYYKRAADAALAPGDRAAALLKAGRFRQDDVDGALAWLEEALDLYRADADLEGQAMVLAQISGLVWWRGETDRSHRLALEAVEMLEGRPDSEAKAHALVSYASQLSLRGLAHEAVEVTELATPVVQGWGSAEDQIKLLSTRGGVLGEEGLEDMATAIGIADDRNFSGQSAVIRNNLATHMHELRSPLEAVRLIDEAIELSEERGLTASAEWARFTKSEILIWTGDWDEALELANFVIRADDARGGSQAGGGARANRAWIRFYRGADVAAEAAESLERAREIQDQQVLAPVLALAVSVAFDGGDIETTLLLADEYDSAAIDVYRTGFLPWVTGPLAALRDSDRIAALLEGSPSIGSHTRVSRARARGHLALAKGEVHEAVLHFLDAAAIADSFDRLFDGTLARNEAAALLVGDERFEETVEKARRGAEALGATKLLAHLDEIEGIATNEAAGA